MMPRACSMGFFCAAFSLLLLIAAGAVSIFPQSSPPPSADAPFAAKPAAAKLYRIAGTILNSSTGDPVSHATVALLAMDNKRTIASTASGDDGSFSFDGLTAGKYSLRASRRGYLPAFYNEHEQYSSAIVTGDDQQTENIPFRLTPEASIEVNVIDEAGDPVDKARILCFRREHNYGVGERIVAIANSITDDAGSRHIYGMKPGEYFVAVTAQPWYAMHNSASLGASVPSPGVNPSLDVAYPVTYFDSVTDEASASPITLAAGARERITVTLHPVPALHLEVPVPQGQEYALPPPKLRQSIFGTNLPSEGSGFGSPVIIANGTAEFAGLPPGHYELQQGDPPRIADLNASASQQVLPGAGTPTAAIHVTLRNANGSALPDKLHLALNWADPAHPRTRIVAAYGKEEASFEAVPPGVYDLMVLSDDESWLYPVASITTNGHTRPRNKITVGDHPLSLAVTLSPIDTRIEAFARKGGKGLAGAMVVLVPNDPASHMDLFRLDQSDSDGSFALQGVSPGHYTLVAIENGWGLEWARPEIISRYLAQGIPVTVTAASGKLLRLSTAVPVQSR